MSHPSSHTPSPRFHSNPVYQFTSGTYSPRSILDDVEELVEDTVPPMDLSRQHTIQSKKRQPKPDINVKMRLFVRIDGISPFVLRLVASLQQDHYKEIVEQYYSELYQGRTPGLLYLHRIVNFSNGDKLFEYKRREVAMEHDFSVEAQKDMNIYDEPEPSDESVIMQKCPVTELCDGMIPKNIALNRLILKITDPYCHNLVVQVFWKTYRSVIPPSLLLKKLIERWYILPLSDSLNYSRPEEIYYNTVIKHQIQLCVVKTMYEWVNHYYFDFDDDMVSTLEQFCITELSTDEFRGLQAELLLLVKNSDRTLLWKKSKTLQQALGVASNATFDPSSAPSLLGSMSEREIAEQLTLADYRIYNEIHFSEMIELAWNKEKKRHMAPNIMNNIEFLNKVASWVAHSILKEEDIRVRKKVLKKFIKILSELHDLNSFNMIQAVNSGLNNAAIHRLSHTWNEIDEKTMKMREPINELIDTKGNSVNLKNAMRHCLENGLACSPYIGINLTHLVFNHDGNPTFIDGKINFFKCLQTYNIMRQILQFQNREYHITANHAFMAMMCTLEKQGEDELYKTSLKIQPRTRA